MTTTIEAYPDRSTLGITAVDALVNDVAIASRRYRRKVAGEGDHSAIEQASADGQVWVLDEPEFFATDAITPISETNVENIAAAALALNKVYCHNVDFDIPILVDPEANPLTKSTDEDRLLETGKDKIVPVGFITPANKTEYLGYMAAFNEFERVLKWSEKIRFSGEGRAYITLAHGLHKMFGQYTRTLGASDLFFEGQTINQGVIQRPIMTGVTFAAHPTRGAQYYTATVTLNEPLDDEIVEGMTVGIRVVEGVVPTPFDENIPLEDEIVTLMMGAHLIDDITEPGRTSFTCTVYDSQNIGLINGILVTNPNLETVKVGHSSLFRNECNIPLSQMAPIGGWDGKGTEAFLNFERGSNTYWKYIGMADHTDTANNPGSTLGDRKMVFCSINAYWQGTADNVINGGEGRTIRTFGTTHLYHIRTIIGGVAKNHVSERGWGLQQNCDAELLRVTSGGYKTEVLELGASTRVNYQQSEMSNGGIGAYVLNDGELSLNSARIYAMGSGILNQGFVEVSTGTLIRSCAIGLDWRSGVGRGSPKLMNNTIDTIDETGFNKTIRGGYWSTSAGAAIDPIGPIGLKITASGFVRKRTSTKLNAARTGVGTYVITFNADQKASTIHYSVQVTLLDNPGFYCVTSEAITGFTILTFDTDGDAADREFSMQFSEIRA